jgi:hypothetical protein
MRRRGGGGGYGNAMRLCTALLVLAGVLVVAQPASADQYLGSGGRPGLSVIGEPGHCKYNRSTTSSWLRVTVGTPAVSGANLRRGRRDITKVRFKAYLMDAVDGDLLDTSSWSGWARVADNRKAYWRGGASFDGLWWRGAYVVDIRIEWWRKRRLRGWRAHRTTVYQYFNHYNIGPTGPFSSCAWTGQ